MPLWKKTQNAFSAGQLDANIMGRQDIERYGKGASKLHNFLVRRQGCISKRRGTDLTADLENILGHDYNGNHIRLNKCRLIGVVNNDNGRYILITGGFAFVATKDGVLMRDGSYSRRVNSYVACDSNNNALRLNTDTTQYADDAIYPYRMSIPFLDDELADINYCQSGDTIFIAHPNHKPSAIKFDIEGKASFDYLSFDNQSWNPPEITSVVFEGQESPTITPNFTGINKDTSANIQCTTEIPPLSVDTNLGVVVSASQAGPDTTKGPDKDYVAVATWSLTYENRDVENKKRTTTVVTKSATHTHASIYKSDGSLKTDIKQSTKDSTSSASTVAPMVMKKIRYCTTYVKDGKESRPSKPYEVEYSLPWRDSAIAKIAIDKKENELPPENYNVYKDNGGGFGFIGAITPKINITLDNAEIDNPYETVYRTLAERNALVELHEDTIIPFKSAFEESGIAVEDSLCVKLKYYDNRITKVKVLLDYQVDTKGYYIVSNTAGMVAKIVIRNKKDSKDYRVVDSIPAIIENEHIVGSPYYLSYTLQSYEEKQYVHKFNDNLRRTATINLEDISIDDNEYISEIELSVDWSRGEDDTHLLVISNIDIEVDKQYDEQFQDDYITPDMTLTPPVSDVDEHFAKEDTHPRCVNIYEQRLVFASSNEMPSTIWFSRVGDLYSFYAHEALREDDAMELSLASTEFPQINNIVNGRDIILLGEGGEWIIKPISGNTLTYKTASAQMQSAIGTSRNLDPIKVNTEVLVVERNNMSIRSINYDYASDSYKSQDLSVLAQDVFLNNRIVSIAYKQHPDSTIECVLEDGSVATLVYMAEQEVVAWSRHTFADGWKARQIVTPKCIINGTTEMMMLMEQDGLFQLWKVRDDFYSPLIKDTLCLDAMHIESSPDNAKEGEVAIGLGGDEEWAIGYPIVSDFVSVKPEVDNGQTAQFEIKNATEIEARVINGSSFKVKPYKAGENAWQTVNIPITMGENATCELGEEDAKKLLVGTNNRDGRIHIRHDLPYPLTILSLSTTYQIEYENQANQEGG